MEITWIDCVEYFHTVSKKGDSFMQQEKRTVDPYLMGAIVRSNGKIPYVLYDIKKIKTLTLTEETIGSYSDMFQIKEHDFSIVEEMENLHTLIVNTRKPLIIENYSFLAKCTKLKKLDLVQTNFTDCAPLAQLTALAYIRLPEKHRLVNTQVLDTLCAEIEFDETTTYDYPIEEIAKYIKEQTKTMAYALTLQKDIAPDLFDSKFGGLPYWNLKMAYPEDKTGQKMIFLAQINFDRATVDKRLPQQGMLQFFIALDDYEGTYGYDGDTPDCQEMFRVVYHETVDYSITEKQILALDIPVSTDPEIEEFTPVWKPFRVEITPKEAYMSTTDKRFDKLFRSAVKALKGKTIGKKSAYDVLTNEDYWALNNELSYYGHNMLGYPFFVQSDPRKKAKYYDTVLLQIHSEMTDDEELVCWADGGVANFFINSEALAQRDFSKIFYCWDCD